MGDASNWTGQKCSRVGIFYKPTGLPDKIDAIEILNYKCDKMGLGVHYRYPK